MTKIAKQWKFQYQILNEVNNRIYSIEKEFNSDTLEQNKKRILQNISDKIKYYARIFGAEYCNDNILFDIENLTLQFSSSSRKDFLWEIGSGHNFYVISHLNHTCYT